MKSTTFDNCPTSQHFIVMQTRAFGCSLKKGTDQPIHKQFSKIKKEDNIVYYVTGEKALLGIFEVTSEMEILNDDSEWGDIAIYKIKPEIMPTTGYYLDWKKLLFDPNFSFDLFPNKY